MDDVVQWRHLSDSVGIMANHECVLLGREI